MTSRPGEPGPGPALDIRASALGVLLAALGAVAFSGKGILIKLAYVHGVDAVTLLALRMLFAAPLFAVIGWWAARRGRDTPMSKRDGWSVAFLGIIGYYLASLCDFIGLQDITAGLERLVLFLYPTFVMLFAAVLFGRRISGRDFVALALSYGGIALVVVNDVSTQPGNVVRGSLWVLASALLYAAYLLGSGRFVARLGSLRFACNAALVSCVAVVVHFLATREASLLASQPAEVYGLTVVMAVFSTVLPIILTSEAIRRIGSSHVALVGAVGPIATIILAFAFLGEPITLIQLMGSALVLAGVMTITLQRGPAST